MMMISQELCCEHFGRRVKSFRLNRNMRQSDLAKKSGYAKGHIASVEAGRCNPSFSMIVTLANVLKTRPSKLFVSYKIKKPKIVKRMKLTKEQKGNK